MTRGTTWEGVEYLVETKVKISITLVYRLIVNEIDEVIISQMIF